MFGISPLYFFLLYEGKLLLQCDQEVQVQAVESAPCRNVRVGKQRLREARIVGLCLGTLAEVSDETIELMGYLYTGIAVLVGVATSCLDPCSKQDSAVTAIVGDYIYSKWALEAFKIANAKRTTTTMAIPSVIPQVGHGKDRVYTNPYPYLVQVERLFPVDR
ncbi:hypothetical protein BC332_28925 [Capsicum chinense]|nr:hypothetical protein BC332_28925 [Capsicum chinense]